MDETFSSSHHIFAVNGILARRCLEVSACKQDLMNAARQIDARAQEINLLQILDEAAAQIRPYVEQDQRKPYTTSRVESAQGSLRGFIEGRMGDLEGQFTTPPAQPPGAP
jgi:hypothetical protein